MALHFPWMVTTALVHYTEILESQAKLNEEKLDLKIPTELKLTLRMKTLCMKAVGLTTMSCLSETFSCVTRLVSISR